MTQYYYLGGKPRPIRFGFGAILNFEKSTGKSMLAVTDEMQKGTMQLTDLVQLVFAGYQNGCRSANINCSETIEDVCDWLDKMPEGTLEKITAQFAESFQGGKQAKASKSAKGKDAKTVNDDEEKN